MEIYTNFRQKVDVDARDVIEKLKEDLLGNSRRWICEKDGKWVIEEDYYHNSYHTVREITNEEKEYFDALNIVYKHLMKP